MFPQPSKNNPITWETRLAFVGEKVKLFNQYSAVWIAAFLVAVAGVFLLRRNPKWPQFVTFGVLVLALVVAWLFLHPRQTSQVVDAARVQASIGQGTPVLLELQSPY
jgi:membrane protein implicated in regulation of membrane protease activity